MERIGEYKKEQEPKFEFFFKAVNKEDLRKAKERGIDYIPGTATKNPEEALNWYYAYHKPEWKKSKKKEYGRRRHIRRGDAAIIAFRIDTKSFLEADEFQRRGVHEHERENCWTSKAHDKAQINIPIGKHVELSDEEAYGLSHAKEKLAELEIMLSVEEK